MGYSHSQLNAARAFQSRFLACQDPTCHIYQKTLVLHESILRLVALVS